MAIYVYNQGLINDSNLSRDDEARLIDAYCDHIERELDARGIHRAVRWDETGAATQRLDPALREALESIEGEDGMRAIQAAARAVYGR